MCYICTKMIILYWKMTMLNLKPWQRYNDHHYDVKGLGDCAPKVLSLLSYSNHYLSDNRAQKERLLSLYFYVLKGWIGINEKFLEKAKTWNFWNKFQDSIN